MSLPLPLVPNPLIRSGHGSLPQRPCSGRRAPGGAPTRLLLCVCRECRVRGRRRGVQHRKSPVAHRAALVGIRGGAWRPSRVTHVFYPRMQQAAKKEHSPSCRASFEQQNLASCAAAIGEAGVLPPCHQLFACCPTAAPGERGRTWRLVGGCIGICVGEIDQGEGLHDCICRGVVRGAQLHSKRAGAAPSNV